MITADQAKERLNRILAARRTASLDAFPKFSQDRHQDERDQPKSEDGSGMHTMRVSPSGGNHQRCHERNPDRLPQVFGSLFAPSKGRRNSHQDQQDQEEWTSHPLEIWRPDGDLDAGKQFRDEWKDRSPKDRERNRQEKHILQNEPALTRNETLQRVVRAERVPAQIDQADGAKEGQTDEREEGRPQRGFGEGMHRTNHTSAGDERSE